MLGQIIVFVVFFAVAFWLLTTSNFYCPAIMQDASGYNTTTCQAIAESNLFHFNYESSAVWLFGLYFLDFELGYGIFNTYTRLASIYCRCNFAERYSKLSSPILQYTIFILLLGNSNAVYLHAL